VSAYSLEIECCGDDLDVVERELRALGYDLAVHDNHTATVVIQTIAITALLI
jgi:hypothetical protein